MPDILRVTVDKFTFLVPPDRFYSPEGLWVLRLGGDADGRVRIGLTDYLQQHSGDVAFAETLPVGTRLRAGDDVGTVETIKVNLALPSPVDGTIVEVNRDLETSPEVINQDPYDRGWLAVVEVTDWEMQKARLLGPDAYFAQMKGQAEAEVKDP